MVRAARCANCGEAAPRGFGSGRDFSYLFPFVIDAEWVATNPTLCTLCRAEGTFEFQSEPYADPYAALDPMRFGVAS